MLLLAMPAEPVERRKTYLKRKKSGLCPRCGNKLKKNSKFSYCDDCREYYRNYNREISESVQEARRKRYEQRKAKKCCPRCGTFLGKKSKNIICTPCLDKQYKYNSGKKRPKKQKKV
jgi:Zn finger protein HypA/HybF involved in hydrogenase expression